MPGEVLPDDPLFSPFVYILRLSGFVLFCSIARVVDIKFMCVALCNRSSLSLRMCTDLLL